MKILAQSAAVVCLALLAPAAYPQAFSGLLKNAVVEKFGEEDMRLLMETWNRALDETPDNQALRWENPATRARGEIIPLRSFVWKDYRCRELRVQNEAPGRKGDPVFFNLCRVEDRWRLLSGEQLER